MNLDGAAVLHADPERVWSVLTDPAVLARTIPGCESLEQVGEDSYRMNVTVGVGAIRGTYAGEVHLTDQQRPTSYVMHASGAGAPGQVRATVRIDLSGDGDTTTLTWSADAAVGGPVAGVGQRMMSGVAKRMAGQFFSAIDAELTGAAVPAGVGAAAGASAPAHARTSAAEASDSALAAAGAPVEGRVFPGRAARTAAVPADLQPVLLGAAGGALLTLIGVLLGYRLGRRP